MFSKNFSSQPDPEKASSDEAAEKEILEKVKASMTEEDLAELARATQDLRLKQETPDPPEALKTVPSLSLQDIPKKPIHVPTEVNSSFSFIANYCINMRQIELTCHFCAIVLFCFFFFFFPWFLLRV